ncbi:FMN-dependent NADH-azoreductase [Pseudonocardia sp.]|uniref:FMN-dependent NADH-azoreductase n=1 Tax=Pseudonocardia sp. TaxID=60912 RepID=UPI003D11CAFD
MTLFRLDASIRLDGSASRELADVVESEWRAVHPGSPVVRRDVGTDPVPAHAWPLALGAAQTSPEQHTAEQREASRLAATLFDELHAADALLLAVPMYNFGVSQHVKGWIDLVTADPRAVNGGAGMLAGKPTVLVTVRGGAYGPGTPRHGWDHSTGYLTRIVGDVWGTDLTVVEREFTLAGVNPTLDEFVEVAEQMRTDAVHAARAAARTLVPARAA